MSFWAEDGPWFCLAPMEEVTDSAFREIVASSAKPGALRVLFTEFTSADALCHPRGREKVRHRLAVSSSEKALLRARGIRLVAQLWTASPEKLSQAIRDLIAPSGDFDGVDINMGCPVPQVLKQGAGSALIACPSLAAELICAAREASPLPVSVKTRIGLETPDTEAWCRSLLAARPAALTLHGRTQSQLSTGFAEWDEIAKAVPQRDEFSPATRILGNGDVLDLAEAAEKCRIHRLDGVMIGRGIFANPWLFAPGFVPNRDQRIAAFRRHAELFFADWDEDKNPATLLRFAKIYLRGFAEAASMRSDLANLSAPCDILEWLAKFTSPDSP
ncbi:MAG: hypothetical protein RL095_3738 [Verrucomicrobiota bacterium]|jgi:tRNA-dihydrouridine synthase